MASFGDIRSIAQRAPGTGTWWDLCDAFESYEGAEPVEDRVLPYCEAQLSRWPPEIARAMPVAWLEALAVGRRVPGARLANAITNWNSVTSAKLTGLSRAAGVQNVRLLELSVGVSGVMMHHQPRPLAPGHVEQDEAFVGALERLFAGPMRGLEVLVLGDRTVDPRLAGHVAALPRLRSLTLEGCRHDEAALDHLAAGPFASLTDLHVQRWAPSSIDALLESSWFGRLEALSLRGCSLDGPWVERVFDDPSVSNLRALDLGVNLLGVDALCALLTSPALVRLEHLTMDRLEQDDPSWAPLEQRVARMAALEAALERATLGRLVELGLRETLLHDGEIAVIRRWASARGVELRYTRYVDQLT